MTENKLYSENIIFLDSADCGSTIGYHINQFGDRLSGTVHLSDCTRKIEWYFSDSLESIIKINKALDLLSEFRDNFMEARRIQPKKRGKKK